VQIRHSGSSPYQFPLPIYVETIGYNPRQEPITRPGGYGHYHWLQTLHGEGVMTREGHTEVLRENSGVLLFPQDAHSYEAQSAAWETAYLTFNGPAASEVLRTLGIYESSYFEWEADSPFTTYLNEMLDRVEESADPFGLQASSDVYRFLITLQKFGQLHKKMAISSNLVTVQPLLDWLDACYSDPNIGLNDMADKLSVSPRRLNHLFRETFNLTPYAYFLYLRIRKAKEHLVHRPELSIGDIASRVGFRDTSHFVATFRRYVGHPPEQFRRMH
jgi:AraC-like DNA-binding protein